MASQDSLRRPLTQAQRNGRWRFAGLGAMSALLAALLLEVVFAATGAGLYFHERSAHVLLFHHAVTQRATRNNLGTGDIQLTLDWKGVADLDLHCDDPAGQRIYFGDRRAPSGGRLDFDMNAGAPPWSSDSIENIFWPFGSAPVGEYVVYVHAYRRHGGPENTPFRVRILHRGKVDWATGIAKFEAPSGTNLSDPVNTQGPQEVFRFRIETPPSNTFGQNVADWIGVATVAGWSALLSLFLVGALLGGLNNWYRVNTGQNLTSGAQSWRIVLGALVWGIAHGILVQCAFAVASAVSLVGEELWRLAAWIILASWIGGRSGHLLPAHLAISDGKRGGRWGGGLGGVAFACVIASIAPATLAQADLPGRLLAALLIGACIGWQVLLPAPQVLEDEEESESAYFLAQPEPVAIEVAPEPIPEPLLMPSPDMRVMRSRVGRDMGGRALGGPRRHSGGRSAKLGHQDEDD